MLRKSSLCYCASDAERGITAMLQAQRTIVNMLNNKLVRVLGVSFWDLFDAPGGVFCHKCPLSQCENSGTSVFCIKPRLTAVSPSTAHL